MEVDGARPHKTLSDAYIAAVFGIFGAHHFYLGRPKFGLLYLCTLGLFGIGFIFDLCRMRVIVNHVNNKPKHEVLKSDVWIICLVLGLFGGHHFYLGNTRLGCYYAFTLGASGVGWIVDLLRIPQLVEERMRNKNDEYNAYLARSPDTAKSLTTAYILAVPPFGIFGPYHLYLGNACRFYVHLFTFGLFGVGWLVDIFEMHILVSAANHVEQNVEKVKTIAYYVGLSPLGILGAHHFMLGRRWNGIFYLFTFGGFGIGWIMDMLRLPVLLTRYTDDDEHKYIDDAYMYWLPFGVLGFHQFYLGRTKWGLFYLCTFGVLLVGWVMDGYRIPNLVREANRNIAGDAVHNVQCPRKLQMYTVIDGSDFSEEET